MPLLCIVRQEKNLPPIEHGRKRFPATPDGAPQALKALYDAVQDIKGAPGGSWGLKVFIAAIPDGVEPDWLEGSYVDVTDDLEDVETGARYDETGICPWSRVDFSWIAKELS